MLLGILQARVSSTRLPGKVLKPILGVPMLLRQIERIKRAKKIDTLLVATSTEKSDDVIEHLCASNAVPCFRGSLDNVLDRFYQAAAQYNPEHIVRLTGDCPLIDPEVIDKTITYHLSGGYDYTSSALEPTFPDGMDVEIFTCEALVQARQEAQLPSHKEHVTSFIYEHPERYKLGSFNNKENLSGLRWTVDEPEDFKLVTIIYEFLYPEKHDFTMQDILNLVNAKQELKTLNAQFMRNEGIIKSKQKDREFLRNGNNV
jgi:spore coat polysaccharide biosynthesis protein SpsF